MRLKAMLTKLGTATALAALAAAPALACMTEPRQVWRDINAALPRAELSDTDLSRVKALRAKALPALGGASKVAGKLDLAKYREAVQATNEAIRIVGLVRVAPRGEGPLPKGCGGTYRLKGETDAR